MKDPRGGKGGVWGIKMAKKMEKNGKKCGVVCGGEGEDAGCHGNRRRERIRVAIAMGLIDRCCHSNQGWEDLVAMAMSLIGRCCRSNQGVGESGCCSNGFDWQVLP